MGSGNKEKRKLRQRGAAAGPEGPAGENPWKNRPKGGVESPKAGVIFDLEPDADRLFQDSLQQWDARLADFEDEIDEIHPPSTGPRSRRGPVEIDLHRMTLEEAVWRVDAEIEAALATGQLATFKIITGKGLHSGPAGGVLTREVHRHIAQKFARHIKEIDESPDEVKIGGVPLRGHFSVTLKKS